MGTDEPVSRQARLGNHALRKIARGEVKPPRRRGRKASEPASSSVVHIRVRPDLWAAARAMTPDPRCIQIVAENEVIIWNHPAPWPSVES